MDEPSSQRGWVEIPGLLSDAECKLVITECERIIADPSNRHHRDKPASGTKHLQVLDDRIELVAELITRSALTTAVAVWFGLEEAPTPTKVSLRSPGPGFGSQDLHRDAIEGPPLDRPDAVTAIIPLVPFDEENGATRLVPGSHITSQPASLFRGRQTAPDEIRLIGAAGTAFVFNGHCLHAGGQNRSKSDRHALQIAWQRHPTGFV